MPAPEVALPDALGAVVRELDLLAEEIDWLELRLGAPTLRPSAPAFEAQALDALLQQVRGLSTFVDGLARGCEPGWRVCAARAAAPLTLAAQKARLGGGEPAPAGAASGELELL